MRVGLGFSSLTFRPSRVSIPAFSVTPVLTRTNRVLYVARIFTKHPESWQFVGADNVFVRFYFAIL